MSEETTYLYHLNMRHMSGRVVKFRQLPADEVDAIQANALRAIGEEGTIGEARALAQKMLLAAFIVGFTGPGQEPARKGVKQDEEGKPGRVKSEQAVLGGEPDLDKLKGVPFKAVDASTLQRDWAKVFNTKETACLAALYRDWHDISNVEAEMILGKGIPSPTGD